GLSAATGRYGGAEMMRYSGQALFEPLGEDVLRQFTADEDHAGIRFFTGRPGFPGLGAEHHVDALEQDAAVDALDVQDALVTQQIGAVDLDDAAEEVFQAFRIEGAVGAEHEGAD